MGFLTIKWVLGRILKASLISLVLTKPLGSHFPGKSLNSDQFIEQLQWQDGKLLNKFSSKQIYSLLVYKMDIFIGLIRFGGLIGHMLNGFSFLIYFGTPMLNPRRSALGGCCCLKNFLLVPSCPVMVNKLLCVLYVSVMKLLSTSSLNASLLVVFGQFSSITLLFGITNLVSHGMKSLLVLLRLLTLK